MSNSLAGLKVVEEVDNNDSTLNTNMEEVGVGEELNMLEVDMVEKEVFITVDASEVDSLETGEDHEVLEKNARRKRLEKLKGEIERMKQNLKDGEKENEPTKAKISGVVSTKRRNHQLSRNRFRPSRYPGARKFPVCFQSPPKMVEIYKEPVEIKEPKEITEPKEIKEPKEITDAESSLQSVESKDPFPHVAGASLWSS